MTAREHTRSPESRPCDGRGFERRFVGGDPGGLDRRPARVRNYQFHPYWGLIADQLWLAR